MNYILLLLSLLFLYCTHSPLSGNGTGTDIGEAKIVGLARFQDYKAAESVYVTIRKQDYIPFSIPSQKQIRTKSIGDGTFVIDKITQGYYLVELQTGDSLSAVKRFYVSPVDTIVNIGDVFLDTLFTCKGKILENEKPAFGANLLVMGMDKRIVLDEDGLFNLRLPDGDQLFRIITTDQNVSSEILFNTKQSGDTIHTYNAPLTVLDDFQDSDGFNNLSSLLGGGGWFAFTDKSGGGNSTVFPTSTPGLVDAIDTSEEAYQGGSLHCIFQIDTTFAAPYALIGCDISSSKADNSIKSWFDFSKMTALTFMAKGSGTIYFQITCKPIISPDVYTVYEVPVALTPQWQKHTIFPSDIPNALASTSTKLLPWSMGNTAVSNINFVAKKPTDLWLDDITIEGMSVADFLKE